MHGRRRHPSRCTAPFKQLSNPGDPKKSSDLPLFGHDSSDKASSTPNLEFDTTQEASSTRVDTGNIPNFQNVVSNVDYSDDPRYLMEQLEADNQEALDNRSLVGKLLGQTPEEDKKRYEATEKKKDATQIAASVAGVGNYLADVGNIGASLGRSIDAAIGLNRPQSWSDAGQHLQGAGYNTLAVANVVPPAGDKTVDFVKGGKDLVKSLTGQGDKVGDVVTTVGNLGYWFDKDTGTIPSIKRAVTSNDDKD